MKVIYKKIKLIKNIIVGYAGCTIYRKFKVFTTYGIWMYLFPKPWINRIYSRINQFGIK